MADTFNYTYKNRQVAYRKIGEGLPLLMLHGWGSNGRVMESLAQGLSGIRTCFIPDLPGFGASEPPEQAWSVDDYAGFIEQFAADHNLQSYDLLVHSFGGRIALKLCARRHNYAHIGKVLITGGAGMKPRRSMQYYLKKYTAKTLKAPFLILPGSLRKKALGLLRQTSLWKSLGSSDYQQLEGVMRETFVKTVTEYLESCLPDIPNEVLLLWGEKDEAAPLYQARRMEEGIRKAALVVIDGAGHYAFLDNPARFKAIAKAFFEG